MNDIDKEKMKNIISLDEYQPHIVRELICIKCKKRFIDVAPDDVWLKDLKCPKCMKKGFLICTGQEIKKEDMK